MMKKEKLAAIRWVEAEVEAGVLGAVMAGA